MPVPTLKFVSGAHYWQKHWFYIFETRLNSGIRNPQFFMQEWHRRARKTTGGINLLIREACRIPQSKYVYVAPTQVMARNIVWDDPNMLKAYLPDKREYAWDTNEQKMLVTFGNSSQLKIGGSDNPDSLRGIDAIGVDMDEFSLHKPEVWTEIFSPIIAGPLPPHLEKEKVFRWANFQYTPKGVNHATQMFDAACCLGEGGTLPDCGVAPKLRPDWYASKLDGELSGILPASEIKRLQQEVKDGLIPQAYYDQEIKCSRVTQEEMTLITSVMIQSLNDYHAKTSKSFIKEIRKIVSIDPGWGGDVCKIEGLINNEVKVDKDILNRHDPQEIVIAAKLVAQEINTKNFIVDTVNDVSIYSLLSRDEANYFVQQFKSSHKATEQDDTQQAIRFANKRAEAYHYTSRLIAKYEVGPIKNMELRRQLVCASKYTTQGLSGRLIIIPKQQIKKELGRSPDDADCYIMGIWGSQFVQPESEIKINTIGALHCVPDHIGI